MADSVCTFKYITIIHKIRIKEINNGGTNINCNNLDESINWYIKEFEKVGKKAILLSITPIIAKPLDDESLIYSLTFRLNIL